MSARVHTSSSLGTSTSRGAQSRVYQNVTYVSAQGTKPRPHPPAYVYENPCPFQLNEGIQLMSSQSWSAATEKLLQAVNSAPMSVNAKHVAGVAYHMLGQNLPMVFRTVTRSAGCCCGSIQVSEPDYQTYERLQIENYMMAKKMLAEAYAQSVVLSPNIRSQIAFSYAMVMQSLGDDDLKRALITRAAELDRDNLDALAVKDGQDRPEFHTHVDVQAHASAHASASASASASNSTSLH